MRFDSVAMVIAISYYLTDEHVTLCVLLVTFDLQDNSMDQEDDGLRRGLL